MARWDEEQDRWLGRDRRAEDERRFREERGEEGAWRSRDWRDQDRFEGWRERGRGERPTYGAGPAERWREGPRRGYGEVRRWGYEPRSERDEERGPLERLGERVREGVRKLTGHPPKGYRRSDERIHEDVCERIARSWVNAEDVEVKVEKGEVTLTGTVERREDKRILEDLADDVFGVEEVHDRLRLSRGEQAAAGTADTSLPAGTGGTGVTMSARQGGTGSPAQRRPPDQR